MSLQISQSSLDAIRHHGEETYPSECCGLLVGKAGPDEHRVARVERVDNAREDAARHHRYLISPEDFMKAEKTARAEGLDVIGFYHSHPDVEAQPSAYDKDHAWPWYAYIIVSVKKRQADHVRAWVLADDRSQFAEETIKIEPTDHTD